MGVVLILLLAVIFAGIAATLFKIFFGEADLRHIQSGKTQIWNGETNLPGAIATVVLLVAILVTGIYLPEGLKDLLHAAQQIIMGG